MARYLRHQDFPYRAIAQTREAGIGGVMIDIGANIGRMSIPRVVLGDATLAYCLEPDPLNYACLVRNIRDNGLAGLALADQPGARRDRTAPCASSARKARAAIACSAKA